MSAQANWPDLLRQISKEILTDADFLEGNLAETLTPAHRQAGWLGEPGATEVELAALEQRLATQLPPSYRTFLQTSNGFGPLDYFIWDLQPCQKVDWLVNTNRDVVELWEKGSKQTPSVSDEEYFQYGEEQAGEQVRGEYFRELLMISDWGDAGFLALNPAVQHEGEWEAWHFASWIPGANRYRSFTELMQATLVGYQALKAE
ncbi:SMI1/KNR4 family protein [Hymenobacter lapidiphilus]|uniref:SMI1/KNR4 family protein n=1 Tax=Hymenobacter lapidiphilus TaxID=2608003 RepID=A0A7Y7PMG3_9BACT|nr:SMI1/KNR4 family protein [Hymenobacter lapidiphilus]NVO30534.1 SMI1/KNR4 family protein [Hymenobacter lapidiphilus]